MKMKDGIPDDIKRMVGDYCKYQKVSMREATP